MRREYHRWHSPALSREMELLVIGHAGARVLVFPTSMGRFFEWEDRGMMQTMSDHIDQGWLQFYCVDSVDSESWYARWKHPNDRAVRQTQYEHYLTREVLPLSRQLNDNPFLITLGASFGAYHAINFALRHPHLVGRAIGLSGFYDMTRWTNGFSGGEVYFQNPAAYLAGEQDPGRLQALRNVDLILAIGSEDSLYGNNEYLSSLLWKNDIWHALRVWNGWYHDWPWWKQMIRLYINGSD